MSEGNPCIRIRKSTGLTVHSFANLLQCSIPVIQQVEHGSVKTSPTVFNALASLGFGDARLLQAEYTAWRGEKSQQAREKIFSARGGDFKPSHKASPEVSAAGGDPV